MQAITRKLLVATSMFGMATAAFAMQDAETAATAATAVAPSTYSDAQVKTFAEATVEVNRIQSDASVAEDQKQAKMAEALQEKGIDPTTYNAIATASNADPVLRNRIIAAASALQQPAAPAAPAQNTVSDAQTQPETASATSATAAE